MELARAFAETAEVIWSQHLPTPGLIALGLINPRAAPLVAVIDTQLHGQFFDSPGGHALGPLMRERLWHTWQSVRPEVEAVERDSVLVHGDLAARNLLVPGRPRQLAPVGAGLGVCRFRLSSSSRTA